MMKFFVSLVVLASSLESSFAANLIERDGRYEVNWTTGKVRFYGVGKLAAGDDSYRAAEQRAWSDGLRAAELDLPKIMAGRLGGVDQTSADRLTKLSGSTSSVNTTYFGDERVKVLLETPMQKLAAQLAGSTAQVNAPQAATAEPVVIQLPKGSKPTAFVKVIDEQGKELVSPKQLASSAQNGSPMAKWFKSKVDSDSSVNPSNSKVISAASTERGVIRVQASEWKPGYTAALTSGAAAFVVE